MVREIFIMIFVAINRNQQGVKQQIMKQGQEMLKERIILWIIVNANNKNSALSRKCNSAQEI